MIKIERIASLLSSISRLNFKNKNLNLLFIFVIYFSAFMVPFILFKIHFSGPYKDYGDFMITVNFTNKLCEGKMYIPHSMLHYILCYTHKIIEFIGIKITMAQLMIFLSCLLVVLKVHLTYLLMKFLLRDYNYSKLFILLVSFLLSLIGCIPIPTIIGIIPNCYYLCYGSPNTLHNPTSFLVIPISLVSILLTLIFLEKTNHRKITVNAGLSLMLLLSVWAKPPFFITFFPSMIIWLIFHGKDNRLTLIRQFIIISLPAILLLIYQYYKLSFMNEFVGKTKFYPLSMFSTCLEGCGCEEIFCKKLPFKILLLAINFVVCIAFPLAVLLINYKNSINDKTLVLFWINLIIGFIIGHSFITEKWTGSGVFLWSYNYAQYYIFIFSGTNLLKSVKDNPKKFNLWEITILLILFLAHLISGIAYYVRCLLKETYSYY